MQKSLIWIGLSIVLWLPGCRTQPKKACSTRICYPADSTIFPPDIAMPTFTWESENQGQDWVGRIASNHQTLAKFTTSLNHWAPSAADWERIKTAHGGKAPLTFSVCPKNGSFNGDSILFYISADSVAAQIFYRLVPLPFKFARENLEKVSWHLGSISSTETTQPALENLPVCGNCHSFTPDGKQLAMDIDARDEKGAYTITPFKARTAITEKNIINWSDFQQGKFTYGLLSQISPDGRYVVSTLKDCEIFVDRHDLEYSQLFFPFKGILVCYDIQTRKYAELAGANDTNYVQSNPAWSPDGKYLYFARSKAAHFEESGIMHGSMATNHEVYNRFVQRFLDRETLFRFDIYRIPFNQGQGGAAEPLKGASGNGRSNYFPKISPDGKWVVFCQAESFMLLQKDSKLMIMPAEGGEPRALQCNSPNMNSWHSWSPNGKWLVYASKQNGPYTQLYLTHIDENGADSPPVRLEYLNLPERAANIPEFVNIKPGKRVTIAPEFLDQAAFDLRRAQILAKQNEAEKALKKLNALLGREPNHQEALAQRADLFMKLNKPDNALADINRAINLNPNNAEFYLTRGLIHSTIGRANEAINDFSKNTELDPYSFMGFNNRGLVKFRMGRLHEAIDDFMKSLALNSQATQTYVNLCAAYAQQKNFETARRYADKAITIDPGQPDSYLALGAIYKDEGRLNDAIGAFGQALELDPANVQALSMRAKAKELLGDLPGAIADMELALAIDSNSPVLLKQAFRLYYDARDYTLTLKYLTQYLQANPNDQDLQELKKRLERMVGSKQ